MTETSFGKELKNKLLEGVQKLNNSVVSTLGPAGRTVLIKDQMGEIKVTKDGVTVAKSIEFTDASMNLGAQIIKEASQQTADNAGDGTTTSTVLAQHIFNEGMKQVEKGSNPIELYRGMQIGVKDIVNGKRDVIQLGNLDSKRDWGHAKDYVYGMWLMLQESYPDDFVLATGKTWTIREFIEKSFLYKDIQIHWTGEGLNEKGIDNDGNIRIIINPKYYRPCEVELLLGDPRKAEDILGWERSYDLRKLIEDMFES